MTYLPLKRERIVSTVRTNKFFISPEDKELTGALAALPWFGMTLLFQDKTNDRTPEFTINKLKTIQTPKSAGESTSLVEDSETVGTGTIGEGDMEVSTVYNGETVGLGGSSSGICVSLCGDDLNCHNTMERTLGGRGDDKLDTTMSEVGQWATMIQDV